MKPAPSTYTIGKYGGKHLLVQGRSPLGWKFVRSWVKSFVDALMAHERKATNGRLDFQIIGFLSRSFSIQESTVAARPTPH